MNAIRHQFRDLWSDSVWFRVCTAVLLVGTLLLVKSLGSTASTRNQVNAVTQNATDQLNALLNDDTTFLSNEQQSILKLGVDSMSTDQRRQYDKIMNRLHQVNHP